LEGWKGEDGRLANWNSDIETTFDISDKKGKCLVEEDRLWLESVRTDRSFTMSKVVDQEHLKSVKRKREDAEKAKQQEESWNKERNVSETDKIVIPSKYST
jgi:hypothetical protein